MEKGSGKSTKLFWHSRMKRRKGEAAIHYDINTCKVSNGGGGRGAHNNAPGGFPFAALARGRRTPTTNSKTTLTTPASISTLPSSGGGGGRGHMANVHGDFPSTALRNHKPQLEFIVDAECMHRGGGGGGGDGRSRDAPASFVPPHAPGSAPLAPPPTQPNRSGGTTG